jgi:acetylornithine deacetylase/succinyl-diaminopimelate desuccinylase-like protein
VLGIKHWYKDEDYLTASYRLAEQPTVNIQGLVSGYMGPGGKTVLPGRAEAKIDLRLVPDMTKDEAVSKLKAHLAKRGFGDIEVNVSGGYGPTQTDENSPLIKAEQATLTAAGIPTTMSARSAGSWPGVVFTGPPLHLPAGQFGGGRGGGAHAPDEWLLIESSNPKVLGFDGQAILYADFLYEVARTAKLKK